MALADGLLKSGNCGAADITLTRRSASALEGLQAKGFSATTSNTEAVKNADLVFLCILPQQLNGVLDEIKGMIDAENQLLVSVVTGVHTDDIKLRLEADVRIIRAMPNTAMRVNNSMTCLSAANATAADMNLVRQIFDTMGTTIIINEEMMSAATALCACGIAFFLRSIRAAC